MHSTISVGAIDEYCEHHARVPAELRELFDRVGIHDWVIWRSGIRLFHLIDCDDFEQAIAAINGDPANDQWQSDIGRFVDEFFGPEGTPAFAPLEVVWSLADQRRVDGEDDLRIARAAAPRVNRRLHG
ncbi:L-rhamnose mutarotase [Agromyces sp. NPDC055658]